MVTAADIEHAACHAGNDSAQRSQEFLDGSSEGLEDLLWSVFLSPEFQFIY